MISPGTTMPAPHHAGAIDTEVQAAHLMTPKAGTLRERALKAIAAAPDGLTDPELAEATGKYLYSIAPRRNELVRLGWVVDSGQRRATDHGRYAAVWVLSDNARKELA